MQTYNTIQVTIKQGNEPKYRKVYNMAKLLYNPLNNIHNTWININGSVQVYAYEAHKALAIWQASYLALYEAFRYSNKPLAVGCYTLEIKSLDVTCSPLINDMDLSSRMQIIKESDIDVIKFIKYENKQKNVQEIFSILARALTINSFFIPQDLNYSISDIEKLHHFYEVGQYFI